MVWILLLSSNLSSLSSFRRSAIVHHTPPDYSYWSFGHNVGRQVAQGMKSLMCGEERRGEERRGEERRGEERRGEDSHFEEGGTHKHSIVE
jgi:hypothetical protein